ncbi:MAG: aspartate dehydrogenase [Clostridia bacterium]|nr:aspartate dehydrogenase [Clostridia bacterium]
MPLFRNKPLPRFPFDPNTQEPAVRRSICTGEMTVGFIDKATGKFHDLMMVDSRGLEDFCRQVGVDEIKTIY